MAGQTFRVMPSLTVILGPPEVGKTTIGKGLEANSNAIYLDIDGLRRHMIRDDKLWPMYGGRFTRNLMEEETRRRGLT